jgi:Tol biopolymer transport system component
MLTNPGLRITILLVLVVVTLGILALAILTGSRAVRIVASSPEVGDEDVPITAPIRLTFSQPMDQGSLEARFRLEPEVTGYLSWEGQEATFWPQPALAPDTAYTVTLEAGATGLRGRPLQQRYSWQFHTRAPQLIFLGRPHPEADARQLFLAAWDGSPPRQLTGHQGGVWDYTVHPQGEAIVYSVLREDGGSDLWRMDRDGTNQRLLLACDNASCLNPAWSPDSRQLAYEWRDIWADAPNLDPKAGRIWILDLEEGVERPLFDYDVPLHSPVWAPRGEQIAYVSPMLPGLEAYDPGTEELKQFANEWGDAPVWSPDASRLVVPELMLAGESLVVRLIRIDLEQDEMVDISGDTDFVKDVAPAWSPGGGWIALGRQFLNEEQWTPGRQIWLTRPDGSEAYALWTEPMSDHFAFAWRPDGAALAYVRSDLSEGPQLVPDVSVWVLDLMQREPELVSSEGVLPGWLP